MDLPHRRRSRVVNDCWYYWFYKLCRVHVLSLLTECHYQSQYFPRYLPWKSLLRFIDRWTDNCISEGNLEGMLLLGLGTEGMGLLQAYLDRTGDVQTVALLGCRQEIGRFGCGSLREMSTAPDSGAEDRAVTTSSVHVTAPRFKEWMSCYRSLLNHWQMWHARATLDIALSERAAEPQVVDPSYSDASFRLKSGILAKTKEENSVGEGTAHPPHLNVRCMFCNQNLPLSLLRYQVRVCVRTLNYM